MAVNEAPVFLSADGKRKALTDRALTAHSMRQMLKRRLKDAEHPELFCPHSFRVTLLGEYRQR